MEYTDGKRDKRKERGRERREEKGKAQEKMKR